MADKRGKRGDVGDAGDVGDTGSNADGHDGEQEAVQDAPAREPGAQVSPEDFDALRHLVRDCLTGLGELRADVDDLRAELGAERRAAQETGAPPADAGAQSAGPDAGGQDAGGQDAPAGGGNPAIEAAQGRAQDGGQDGPAA